jgi:hypothetical protein
MTTLATPHAATPRFNPTDILIVGIGFQVALFAPSLIAALLDPRTLNDVSVWAKPIKFQLSLTLHLVTLFLLMPLVSQALQASRLVRVSLSLGVIGSTYEIAYITLQAARGVASHYNNDTPIEAALYSLMGLGATAIVVGAAGIGVAIARSPDQSGRAAGLRLGAASGLILGAIATLITAFIMASGYDGPGHWVGGERSDANGLPLVGWSTTGGDLRVPHFFATHLMQALPIVGLLADRLAPRLARPLVVVAALLGIAMVAATFLQAISGLPVIALNAR